MKTFKEEIKEKLELKEWNWENGSCSICGWNCVHDEGTEHECQTKSIIYETFSKYIDYIENKILDCVPAEANSLEYLTWNNCRIRTISNLNKLFGREDEKR